MPVVNKKVNLELVGLDDNALSLMGAFQKQARREGWTDREIDLVLEEAKSSDYDHLVKVLSEHCVGRGYVGDEEDEFNDWDHMSPADDEDSWYDDDPRYYEI